MTQQELKEANRLFWIVKNRLIPSSWNDKTIKDMYDDFFKRVWCNEEAYVYEEGFEEAWQKRISKPQTTNSG